MKISILNELKRHYECFKVAETLPLNIEGEDIPIDSIKKLESFLIENNRKDIIKFCQNLSKANWVRIKEFLELPLYHIVYYPDKNELHSKGIDVNAFDMISAIDSFLAEFGYEPFYVITK